MVSAISIPLELIQCLISHSSKNIGVAAYTMLAYTWV